jgi:catechol 2,3-dioxygenase-like lactoylglutathione lyase family enzyme
MIVRQGRLEERWAERRSERRRATQSTAAIQEERSWRVAALLIAIGGLLAFASAIVPPAHGAERSPTPPAPAAAQAAPIEAVASIGITVSDLDRSIAFFTKVLDFETVSETEVAGETYERLTGVFAMRARVATLRLGEETITLTQFLAPRGRPRPEVAYSNDRWFQHIAIIVSDMDRAYARLRGAGVEHVSPGPQLLPEWNKNAGGISAFYFRDPDGHALEILHFPPDKGAAKWHRDAGGRLFLGIDHTAIVVSDTEASLRFYRDLLGLRVAGESENYGPEQERLNSVHGARLRITGIRAGEGPGIEFLQYLAPGAGRPMPVDERANDLIHWQTMLRARGGTDLPARFRAANVPLVTPGVIDTPDHALGFARAILVRDPDGHVMEIVNP